MCGAFYLAVRWAYTRFPDDKEMVHSVLEKMMSSLGDKNRLVFYIDGEPALEKHNTYRERRQKREKAGKEAETALDTLDNRIDTNKCITCQYFLRINKYINAAFY